MRGEAEREREGERRGRERERKRRREARQRGRERERSVHLTSVLASSALGSDLGAQPRQAKNNSTYCRDEELGVRFRVGLMGW